MHHDVGTLLPSTIESSHWLQVRTPRKEESVTQPSQAHHAQPYVAHSYVARGRQALHATAGRFARARWRRRGRRGQRMTREDGPTALHPPVYPLATTAFTPATLTWFFVASDVFITDSTLARHDYAIARHDRACWQRIVIAESQEAESRLYSRLWHLGPRGERVRRDWNSSREARVTRARQAHGYSHDLVRHFATHKETETVAQRRRNPTSKQRRHTPPRPWRPWGDLERHGSNTYRRSRYPIPAASRRQLQTPR